MNAVLVVWPLVGMLLLRGRRFPVARGITVATLGLQLAIAVALCSSDPLGLGPALTAAVGLVAAAMMSARGAPVRWFAQILAMTAAATLVTGFADLRLLAVGWVLHILAFGGAVWRTPARRVFVLHMSVSVLAVVAGVFLMLDGQAALGVWALAIGIGIREAVLPAHAWLPNVMRHAPLPLVVVFVAPQIGIAAHMVMLSGAPPAGFELVLATAAAVTALGGAMLGVFQHDARKALAYLLVSQSGLVAFGLEAHSSIGRSGAILVWLTSSVAFAGFSSLLAAVEARRGRLDIEHPTGNFERIPRLATAWLFLGLACVGLPGTVGFVAEDLLVEGAVDDFPLLAMVIVLTTAINGIAVLRIFFGVFTGTRSHAGEQDMLPREKVASTAVMALLIVLGLAPQLVTRLPHTDVARAVATGRSSSHSMHVPD